MMLEPREMFRARHKTSGLEVLVFLILYDQPRDAIRFVCADPDGDLLNVAPGELQMNWRYNPQKDEWGDVDLAIRD